MSSVQVSLPQGVWIQLTTSDKTGSIRHHAGNTAIVYTESPTIPADLNPNTPVMEVTVKGQDWGYFNVGASDFVWAYANSADAVIVISPGGA